MAIKASADKRKNCEGRVMNKLLPCPFCGAEAELVKDKLWHGSHGYYGCYNFYIKCSYEFCGVSPQTRGCDNIYEKDEKKIIEKIVGVWNFRRGVIE